MATEIVITDRNCNKFFITISVITISVENMIIIWVDKYYFRCNLAIGNGIKKFYYNFGCFLQFWLSILNRNCNNRNCNKKVITISVGYYNFGCHNATKTSKPFEKQVDISLLKSFDKTDLYWSTQLSPIYKRQIDIGILKSRPFENTD